MNDYERQRNHRTNIFQENEILFRGPVPQSIKYNLTPQISHPSQSSNIQYVNEYTNDGIMRFISQRKKVCVLNCRTSFRIKLTKKFLY